MSQFPEEYVECAYCGHVTSSGGAAELHDDEAWEEIARDHAADCEWVITRAHRIEEDTMNQLNRTCQFCNDSGVTPAGNICKRCYAFARLPQDVRDARLSEVKAAAAAREGAM